MNRLGLDSTSRVGPHFPVHTTGWMVTSFTETRNHGRGASFGEEDRELGCACVGGNMLSRPLGRGDWDSETQSGLEMHTWHSSVEVATAWIRSFKETEEKNQQRRELRRSQPSLEP